jgi:hypothetical protein
MAGCRSILAIGNAVIVNLSMDRKIVLFNQRSQVDISIATEMVRVSAYQG